MYSSCNSRSFSGAKRSTGMAGGSGLGASPCCNDCTALAQSPIQSLCQGILKMGANGCVCPIQGHAPKDAKGFEG